MTHELTTMNEADKAIQAIERLRVPQGRLEGEPIHLAGYQRDFIHGALAEGVTVGVWSVGRGNAKSATAAALAVTHLIGCWGNQPQREIVLAGRTKEQAAVAFRFAQTFLDNLPDDMVTFGKVQTREHPHFSLKLDAADGPHELKAVSADGKSQLGGAATLALCDERSAWRPGRGEEMEAALLTSLGKRDGRMLIISTSAPDDANSFSQWCDRPPTASYVQEHRPAPGLPADDYDSLMEANPGAVAGIGARPDWLVTQARQAIERGGQALASFRNLHRNERVTVEARDVLVNIDDWLACEVDQLPPREGRPILGLDLGGATSMTAAAIVWPQTGRLESVGAFPNQPTLLNRGQNDSVGNRYVDMHSRGELITLGEKVVPVGEFLGHIIDGLDCEPSCIIADRFRQAELEEALSAAKLRMEVVFRGMGYRDGSEDVERFRQSVFDRKIKVQESLLLRGALSDSVTICDPAGNSKLVKGRSIGRIDAAAAAVLAVAEAGRQSNRTHQPVREPLWV